MNDETRGRLLTLGGVICLSPDALLVRLAGVDPWTILFWRGLGVFLVMGGLAVLSRRRAGLPMTGLTRPQWWLVLFFIVGNITFVNALAHTNVTNVLVILGAAPLFGAVASGWMLKERVARKTWLASLLVVGGLSFVFRDSLGQGTVIGDVNALVAALVTGLTFVVLRGAPQTSIFEPLAVASAVVATIVFPFAAPLSPEISGYMALAALGLVVLPSSFYLTSRGPVYIPAPEVSLIMLLEMIIGPLWVWMAIGELPSVAVALAAGFVVIVLVVHTLLPQSAT